MSGSSPQKKGKKKKKKKRSEMIGDQNQQRGTNGEVLEDIGDDELI